MGSARPRAESRRKQRPGGGWLSGPGELLFSLEEPLGKPRPRRMVQLELPFASSPLATDAAAPASQR